MRWCRKERCSFVTIPIITILINLISNYFAINIVLIFVYRTYGTWEFIKDFTMSLFSLMAIDASIDHMIYYWTAHCPINLLLLPRWETRKLQSFKKLSPVWSMDACQVSACVFVLQTLLFKTFCKQVKQTLSFTLLILPKQCISN